MHPERMAAVMVGRGNAFLSGVVEEWKRYRGKLEHIPTPDAFIVRRSRGIRDFPSFLPSFLAVSPFLHTHTHTHLISWLNVHHLQQLLFLPHLSSRRSVCLIHFFLSPFVPLLSALLRDGIDCKGERKGK